MLMEKEASILRTILELSHKLSKIDIGIPIESLFKEIKRKGIYFSSRMIGEKLKRFQNLNLIKVNTWNITYVDKSEIDKLLQQYSESSQKEKVSELPKETQEKLNVNSD